MLDIFPLEFLLTFEVVTFLLLMFYQTLADLIPSFIYCHTGAAITAILDEINDKKDTIFTGINTDGAELMDPCRILLEIWSKYYRIRQLVRRANDLFGWMLLIDFGIKFYMMVSLLYYELYFGIFTLITTIAFLLVLLTCVIRLVNGVSLITEVESSREQLIFQMSIHYNTYWLDMESKVRKVYSAFKSEVSSDQLAASPMGLFNINAGLLLSILSLTVTYLVILFQFN